MKSLNIKTESIICLQISLIVGLLYIFACSSKNQDEAIQWQRWQHTLSAKMAPKDRAASLRVVFTGSEKMTFEVPAFTDDGKTYYFRFAFPDTGEWQWKTVCDNPGIDLNKKKGKVDVKPYEGENPLYRHGSLAVSSDKRYLTYADGKPFLWIGDAGWNAQAKLSLKEWQEYVDKRASQGFSVIQVNPRGLGNKATASSSPRIAITEDGKNDTIFWHDLEEKIAYANDKGLVVLLGGMGSAWRDTLAVNSLNQDFEPYVVGRFASFHVILSPCSDQLFEEGLDLVAARLQKVALNLVTQNSGTNYKANLRFRNSPWTDFAALQSGHHYGRLNSAYQAARAWALEMWNAEPVKPVINIEGMYDARGNNNGPNWREKDVRKIGWISWLSGSKGYAYGAGDVPPKVTEGNGGVWRFNKDTTTYDYWKKALDWPSAGQMTIMRDFFSSVEWWRLVPEHERVLNQAEADTLIMVVAGTKAKDLILAYLPDNPEIILDLKDYTKKLLGEWLNLVDGTVSKIPNPIVPADSLKFNCPEDWEDALLILKINTIKN